MQQALTQMNVQIHHVLSDITGQSGLARIWGVDLTAVPSLNALTAYTLLAEVGTDLSRFRNIHAFASPGPASVPTIRRAEEKSFPPKPAGVPIASIAPCG